MYEEYYKIKLLFKKKDMDFGRKFLNRKRTDTQPSYALWFQSAGGLLAERSLLTNTQQTDAEKRKAAQWNILRYELRHFNVCVSL